MSKEDRQAWAAASEVLLHRPYSAGYWRRVKRAYNPSFAQFLDERLDAAPS